MMKWVSSGEIPNVLLEGTQGTGKSTASKLLVSELGVAGSDVMTINCSLNMGIDRVRELEQWCKKRSHAGGWRIVQLEEFDRITHSAALAMRDVTEAYSSSVRFIATCNHVNKIHPALVSRFQVLNLGEFDDTSILEHVVDIIEKEKIEVVDEDYLSEIIFDLSPDLRKIINTIDQSLNDKNQLIRVDLRASDGSFDDWEGLWTGDVKVTLTDALRLSHGINGDNFEQYFDVMFNNHDKFDDPGQSIVLMSKYLDRAYRVANQVMNLQAFLYHNYMEIE
jgi:DNA polymerase III delta prime subunit